MKLANVFRCLFLSGMVMFFGVETFAQNVTVKGKVSDSNGEPIIGVTVMLNGNNTVGSLTDANGNYSITVPANSTLSFSCVGFATQEEQLNGRNVINVVLQDLDLVLPAGDVAELHVLVSSEDRRPFLVHRGDSPAE